MTRSLLKKITHVTPSILADIEVKCMGHLAKYIHLTIFNVWLYYCMFLCTQKLSTLANPDHITSWYIKHKQTSTHVEPLDQILLQHKHREPKKELSLPLTTRFRKEENENISRVDKIKWLHLPYWTQLTDHVTATTFVISSDYISKVIEKIFIGILLINWLEIQKHQSFKQT